MKKSSLLLFAIIATALLLNGCASIIYSAHQDEVKVVTRPAGVVAKIGNQSCVTPCALTNVLRKSEIVTFAEGNGPEVAYKLDISTNVLANIPGNLISWGPIGWIVDSKIGGKYRIEDINFTLHPKTGEQQHPDEDVLVRVQ